MPQVIFKNWDVQPQSQKDLLVILLKAHLAKEELETIEQLYALKSRKSISFDTLVELGYPKKQLKPVPMHLRRMHLIDSYRKSAIHLTDNGINVLINNRSHWEEKTGDSV